MHNGCILCGGVGVGKSHTAVGYYLQNEAPKPVYVITTAKKRDKGDWQAIWIEVGMHYDPELTMGATVVVDSWENVKKYEEVTDAFFIFDEQRLVGSGRWVKAFYKIAAANRWIMLSATPGDNWLDYVPVFRANGFIKNLTQFKEDHVISRWTGRYYQVTGYRQTSKLNRWRSQLLVDMPYQRHTTRHTHYVDVGYDQDLVRKLVKERWNVYENRPLTDASELFRVMRRVVYTDSSRIRAVQSLLQTHPKLIVFYNFNYELEMLRQLDWSRSSTTNSPRTAANATHVRDTISGNPWEYLLSPEGLAENARLVHGATDKSTEGSEAWQNQQGSGDPHSKGSEDFRTSKNAKHPQKSRSFQIAEWNGHKHEPIPQTDSWVYLVQYVAGAEAWETTETDAICFYSMPYSYKLWWQAHGRIDRLNTSFLDLHYFVLFGDSVLEKGVKQSLAQKKSFNEAAYGDFLGVWQK